MQVPLVELKDFIDIKPFPSCKIHKSNQIKYFCNTVECKQFQEILCSQCAENHQGHFILDIRSTFHYLLNEIATKESKDEIKIESYQILFSLKKELKIIVDLFSSMLESIEKVILKFQNLLDFGASSKDIIRNNIEKCLTGKNWKESTVDGLNNRIKNIVRQCDIHKDNIKIHSTSGNSQRNKEEIQFFTKYCLAKIQDICKIMDGCLCFTTQKYGEKDKQKDNTEMVEDSSFLKIMFDTDANKIQENTKKIWLYKINYSILDKMKNSKQLSVIYLDMAGHWNTDTSAPFIIQKMLRFKDNVEVVWLNLNGWKNMGNKEITQISTGLTFTNNLKMLILNLASWGEESNKNLTEESLKILGKGLETCIHLESLSLWLGWWVGIRDAATTNLINGMSKLENLTILDIALQNWGAESHKITDLTLNKLFRLVTVLKKLKQLTYNFDRWGYKNNRITMKSFNELFISAESANLESLIISMKEQNALSDKEIIQIRQTLKRIIKDVTIEI